MIATVARRYIFDSLRRYPWVFPVRELIISLLTNCGEENFPEAQLLQLPQITAQSVASWDREGPFIQSFTVLRKDVIYSWCQEQPLLCHCTKKTLRSLRIVPSSQSWCQTTINRKGQSSPLSQWKHKCTYVLSCQDPSVLLM